MIIAYYNTPEDQRPSRNEFAKSINHSSRAVKERYEKYLSSCREFTEEECDQLVYYAQKYNNSWVTISKKFFNKKFSSHVLRDKFKSLMKRNQNIISSQNKRNQNIISSQNIETINDDSNNSADVIADIFDENVDDFWDEIIDDFCNGPIDF